MALLFFRFEYIRIFSRNTLSNNMATPTEVPLHTHQRMFDIANGLKRMLMPIAGFENMPLVTLEDAVVPLMGQLPDIKAYVDVAKSRCDPSHVAGLTVDESASIMLLTIEWEPQDECLYVVLNATLRTEDRRKLKPWFSYLKLVLTALSKLPSATRRVYRGVKEDLSGQYKKGRKSNLVGFFIVCLVH